MADLSAKVTICRIPLVKMTEMKPQYDAIQGPYDFIRTASIALIERENVSDAVAPYVKDARVLE